MLKHDGGDHKLTNRAPLSCLFGVIPVSLLTLIASFIVGLSVVDNTSATAYTLTVSITDNISVDILPTINGTFATSDTSANNISVTTNNGTGYTLGIKAKTENSNALINTVDSTKTIPSISSSSFPSGVSASNYADNTYALANNLNNTYAYKPSKLNSVNNSNYLALPTSASNTTILDRTTVSNPSTANNYNIAIGTRIDKTQASGSYANTLIISVVANPAVYSITYNANGGSDTVTNMPTNVSNQETYNTSVNISSTVPVRDGYNFKGWCTAQVADGVACTGTTYNPDGAGTNLAWTIDQTLSSNSLTLYAMWEQDACYGHESELYCKVASMSKGKNTGSSSHFSWTSITQPTSTNPATDTSSSGVFEWDGMTAGNGIDSNGGTQKIYFYRGILDTTLASYGSDGLADAYPNYVRLGGDSTSSTCWRIVRTTSTGGVKMIYNGTWTGTTCANATTNAQTMYNGSSLTVPFNTTSSTKAGKTYTGLQYQNIHAVGYTYSNVPASTTTATAISTLFGSSGNDTTTNTSSSIMKQYIEDWYASTLTSYTSKLEGDAGFCQDRRLNTSTTWTSPLAESTTIVPYGTSGMTTYYFGAYPRNTQSSTFNPLLTCPRGKVDLYSYSSNAGNGNGQLTYPVALLTADEASLAGDGWSNSFSAYNANSFLRSGSGSDFWLLSPNYRYSNGRANEFYLSSNGTLGNNYVSTAYGVRPSISLKSGTTANSGTGTATDPWIVTP